MVDVNLKVPGLEKLLEYTANGIGAIAGPMVATWKARREVEAKRIVAQGNADARAIEARGDAATMQILAQAQAAAQRSLSAPVESGGGVLEFSRDGILQRTEFQEQKRQHNIASVVYGAAANLGDEAVGDHAPDPDWTARFFATVQDISSEDMKELWAKVLSGEVRNPSSTSLRTLDVLKNMTSKDAHVFNNAAQYVIDNFIFSDHAGTTSTCDPALSVSNLLTLEDCGLLRAGRDLAKVVDLSPGIDLALSCGDFILRISRTSNSVSKVQLPTVAFLTAAGRELLPVTERQLQIDYLRTLAKFLESKDCELSRTDRPAKMPVAQPMGDGEIWIRQNFIKIEPKSDGKLVE